MEITVQITVKSQAGEPEVVHEVARLERGTLFWGAGGKAQAADVRSGTALPWGDVQRDHTVD